MVSQRKRRYTRGHQCRDEARIKVWHKTVALKWGNAHGAKRLTGGRPLKKKH